MSDREFSPFDADVEKHGAYVYTRDQRMSSTLANARLSALTFSALAWEGLRALDMGCGDGAYTLELYDAGKLYEIHGIDPAAAAIATATTRVEQRRITFAVHSGYELPFGDDAFDIVHLRGVLHHMDRPELALKEALRVAPRVFIIEPNGWNPILKGIEQFSSYHRAHHEKSYSSRRIDRWLAELNAVVVWRRWAGLVPFFCPDGIARILKMMEPWIERTPLMRNLGCAVYAVVAQRETGSPRGQSKLEADIPVKQA